MEKQNELFSLSDFIVILIRNRVPFILVWTGIMAVALIFQIVSKKTYQLKGTIYVGKFQEILLEEGEFVAKRLTDYAFVKKALDNHKVAIEIPVQQLIKDIKTEVVNEVKKTSDVGIVELSVSYKDPKLTYEIYKALTDQLIEDHAQLIKRPVEVMTEMIVDFQKTENDVANELAKEESYALASEQRPAASSSVPAHLLLRHTVSERTQFLKKMNQDRHYLEIESNSATKSFNTKLSAEPAVPDDFESPRLKITMLVGGIMATVLATIAALLWNLFQTEVKRKLKEV